jgi:hypothetical protein
MLERACRLAASAVREQAPSLLLRARTSEGPRYLIDPILPLGETAVLFGDGGAGKGFASLALGLAATSGVVLPGRLEATHRVLGLYLDWESTVEEVEERLHLLTRGLGCTAGGLYYRRITRALADDVATLQAEVSRLRIGLVIVDSLAPACGAEPEGADAAIRCMNALRMLGRVTKLVQAHVSKAGADQRIGAARPFGGVFVQNLARSVWEIRRSEDSAADDLTVGLYHRETNRGQLHPPLSLRFHFGDDMVTLHAADLRDSSDLLARAASRSRSRRPWRAGHRLCGS